MKILSVCGITKSGKTTTIEEIIKELTKRGYKVGSVKEIHFEQFKIDFEGSNTDRHKDAGSKLVVARGINETDILFQENLSIEKIISFYDKTFDYLILEGVTDAFVPVVVTSHGVDDANQKWSDYTVALSGVYSEQVESFNGKPAISALQDIERLVDLIEAKTFEQLPYMPKECCNACGYSCETFALELLNNRKSETDCKILNPTITVTIGETQLKLAPFVQNIVKNSVLSVIKELDGYSDTQSIKIEIGNHDSIL